MGMKNDYLVTRQYDNEIFNQIYKLSSFNNWENICTFMEREYKLDWLRFIKLNECNA